MFYEILLLITFFLLGLYLSWADIRLALLAYVLLIPFAHKELFSFTFWDLLPVRVLFFGLVVSQMARLFLYVRRVRVRKALKKVKEFYSDRFLELLFLLLVIRILSIFFSSSLKDSFLLLTFYTSIVILFMVLKFAYERFGYSLLRYLLKLYVIVGLATGIFSFVQLFVYEVMGQVLPGVWALVTREGSFVRVGSIFWDINHYGAYIASILPIAAAFTLVSKRLKPKILWGMSFVYGFIVLLMTQSRSAWGAFGISMILVALILLIKRQFKTGLPLYIGGILLLIGVVVASVKYQAPVLSRLDTITDIRNNDSIKTHIYLLTASFEMFMRNPLLGAGYGSFSSALRETNVASLYFSLVPSENEIKVPAHSIWGEVLGETGALGLIVYSLVMYLILKEGVVAIKRSDGEKLLFSTALFASICGLLAAGVLYSYNLEFFWAVLFLGILMFKEARAE